MDDFIERWHARVHGALTEALVWLAGHERLPEPDGVIGDFVDVLCAMRFTEDDRPHVIALAGKSDPHFQEIGIRLATSAIRDTGEWGAFEEPIATMIARGPVDPWVAEALVTLLRTTSWSFAAPPALVYVALAKRHREAPRTHGIMRNRAIRPWDELEDVYAQHVIQTLEPGEREKAILPILERKLGTKGFRATQDRILRDMGFDPEEHRARLRGV